MFSRDSKDRTRGRGAGATGRLLSALAFSLGTLTVTALPASPAAGAAEPAVPGGQSLEQVWTIGATTAWAWTQGEDTGSPQGLELTTNGGKTWSDVTPPALSKQTGDHFITGFYALSASDAWVTYGSLANGAAQTIASTSDGGRRWSGVGHEPLTKVAFSSFVYDCGLDFVTPSDGWCETTPAFVGSEAVYLYRSTNGGKTWQLVSDTPGPPPDPSGSLPWGGDKDIQFVSPTKGWAIFSAAGAVTAPLYETVSSGKTWIKRNVTKAHGTFDSGSGFTGQPVVSGSRGAVGYTIAGRPLKSVVYVTTDGGTAWHAITPPGKPQAWVVDAITPSSWRLVHGDHILATSNGGRTWRTITSNVTFDVSYPYDDPTAPVVHFATSAVGWIYNSTPVGASLWRTTDGGRTWRQLAVPGTRRVPSASRPG